MAVNAKANLQSLRQNQQSTELPSIRLSGRYQTLDASSNPLRKSDNSPTTANDIAFKSSHLCKEVAGLEFSESQDQLVELYVQKQREDIKRQAKEKAKELEIKKLLQYHPSKFKKQNESPNRATQGKKSPKLISISKLDSTQ